MNMRQLRERVKLRTVDVASKLGVTESTVLQLGHGRSVPKFELVKPLLSLWCSFEELDKAVASTKEQVEIS